MWDVRTSPKVSVLRGLRVTERAGGREHRERGRGRETENSGQGRKPETEALASSRPPSAGPRGLVGKDSGACDSELTVCLLAPHLCPWASHRRGHSHFRPCATSRDWPEANVGRT